MGKEKKGDKMASPNEVSLARIKSFLHSHLLLRPPYPTQNFTNQTIIVTGSNTGMGLEAARHFLRLDAGLVILAVRDLAKGAAARDSLLKSFSSSSSSSSSSPSSSSPIQQERVQVWELDLASYTSVTRFAERVNRELERVDVLVSNAAMYVLSGEFRRAAEGEQEDEMTVRVNVVCTMMLAVLLLPKLRETSVKYNKETVCTFTGSFVHFMTAFPERKADDIFGELAVEKRARMNDRLVTLTVKVNHFSRVMY